VLCLVACFTAVSRADDRLKDLLAALEGAEDVTTRRAIVRKIASQDSPRAAARLVRIAKGDSEPSVRALAARSLGGMRVKDCEELQLALLDHGGVKEVRRGVAMGLMDRGGQLPALQAILADSKAGALSRGLAIEALTAFPDPQAVMILEDLARGDDPYLRTEAMRALGRHKQGREIVPGLLVDVLGKHTDLETVLTGLDLAADLSDTDFRPVADMLDTFLQPEVRPAVEAARARMEYLEALAAFKATKGTAYDSGGERPEPPPQRSRLDMVYVFDSTGSVVGHLDLIIQTIKEEAALLTLAGGDVRVGLVAFRDTPRRRNSWETQVLPLTYDVERAERFFRSVDAGGADSRGAAIGRGLHQGLDRMGWRWHGRRHAMIVADSKAGKQDECEDVASIHFRTDRTRIHVWYLFRTRVKVPESIERLARIGGGAVRIIDRQ